MKLKRNSIGIKLWKYFAVFSVIIIAMLWILQTILLQGFYDSMQTRRIKSIADDIADIYGSDDANENIDGLAADNSLLILITDAQSNVLYSADEYSVSYREHDSVYGADSGKSENPYREKNAQTNGNPYRNLPDNYNDFIERLNNSDKDEVCYRIESEYNKNATLVYGRTLKTPIGDAVLYINTTLGAVGSTVYILRVILCIVTFAALLIGFILAFFISKRFAKPVSALSEQAERMAEGNFGVTFDKGFCSELDALAETLDNTAVKLSVNDKLRRELLANVSHDLRTPLTMIKGYAELVKETSDEDNKTEKQDLDVIIREADRLSSLVNDILDYSKMQSGSMPFDFKRQDITVAARTVIESFSGICVANGILIKSDIAENLYVFGDIKRIKQVLYNLISNAIAHIGEDKTVLVSARSIGNAVRVEVRDNGSGISSDELPYVWDRYFTNKKRLHNGIGLGLSIVKEILSAHNAGFGVESEPGEGSTFWFEMAGA